MKYSVNKRIYLKFPGQCSEIEVIEVYTKQLPSRYRYGMAGMKVYLHIPLESRRQSRTCCQINSTLIKETQISGRLLKCPEFMRNPCKIIKLIISISIYHFTFPCSKRRVSEVRRGFQIVFMHWISQEHGQCINFAAVCFK